MTPEHVMRQITATQEQLIFYVLPFSFLSFLLRSICRRFALFPFLVSPIYVDVHVGPIGDSVKRLAHKPGMSVTFITIIITITVLFHLSGDLLFYIL